MTPELIIANIASFIVANRLSGVIVTEKSTAHEGLNFATFTT